MKLRLLQRNIKRKETYYNSSALLRNFHTGVRGRYGARYRQLAENDNFTESFFNKSSYMKDLSKKVYEYAIS